MAASFEEQVRAIQRERGWGDATVLHLVLDKIWRAGHENDILESLRQAADHELASIERLAAQRRPSWVPTPPRREDDFTLHNIPSPKEKR